MVSFARAKTRSLLSKLLPMTILTIEEETLGTMKSEKLIEKQQEQNKFFLESTKFGGVWFS